MDIKAFGLQEPKSIIAQTAQEAVRFADEIGYPVVLKINSPDIMHKTDIGGVRVGVANAQEVESAFSEIMDNASRHYPIENLNGVEVQEMVQEGVEIIIGLLQDPQFGMTMMFGLGGILTEILNDVSFRVLPITADDALAMIHEIKGHAILSGYRGAKPVSERMLVELLLQISSKGYENRHELEAVDLNPVVVWEDQYRVLDAKFYPKSTAQTQITNTNVDHLEKFFNAKSIAVIGASDTEGKVGYGVLDSLVNYEYQGKVYPVNPTHSEIMGIKTYPSLTAIPDQVELAIMTANIKFVPDVLSDCRAKGVHNLVVISGGGKELGGDKSFFEAELREKGKSADVRMIGPNCTGVFDGKSRIATFFQTQDRMARPKDGKVAYMTQSGTVGNAMLEDSRAFGVRNFVSYGNRIDVDEADLLDFWGNDPEIKVVGIYVEGFEKGRKFLDTVKRVSARKPVVIYKSARTELGAKTAASHTGNLGGSHKVVEGALRQSGAISVNAYDELISAVKVLALQPEAAGRRVGMISNGAGPMIQAIDYLTELGLTVPPLSESTVSHLLATYPPFYIVHNPVDITGSGTSEDYAVGIEALLEDPAIDIVMPWFVFVNNPITADIIEKLDEINRKAKKPIIIGAFGGEFSRKMMDAVEEIEIPVYTSVRDWVTAAHAISWRTRKTQDAK